MSNSIYNINAYDSLLTYEKHDIVVFSGTFKNLSISNGFLYCVEDSTTGTFDENDWDGYVTDSSSIKPKFLWVPTKDNSVNSAPKVRVLKFGDGYESRVPNGINNNLITYDLSFESLTINETTAIIHFFETRNAQESFIWAGRPPYVKNLRYVVREWNNREIFTNNFSISAKFEQVVN